MKFSVHHLLCALVGIFAAQVSVAAVTQTEIKSANGIETRIDVNVEGLGYVPSQHSNPTKGRFAQLKFAKISLDGVGNNVGIDYQPGQPNLPTLRFLVEGSVSVNVGVETVAIELPSGMMVEPVVESAPKIAGAKSNVSVDVQKYEDARQPSISYSIESAGSVRGVPRHLVTVYPKSYDVNTGVVTYPTNISISAKKSSESFLFYKAAKPKFAFIVGKKFQGSKPLADYQAFKATKGFDVVVGNVGKDFNTPAEIRAWLQARLAGNLKYALIIGDSEDVPAQDSDFISGVTDHYYRAIDTNNYATDINGPDIGVGRISVSNEAELKNVVDKMIRYQTTVSANSPWIKKTSFLATDDRYEVAEGTHNYAIDTYLGGLGFLGSFPQAAAKGGDKLYAITYKATRADVAKAFNEGRSIIDYSGHGATTYWAGPNFTQSDVKAITSDALPFVVSNACITGQFTLGESFAETWQRHPAAAIAFWGSMDNTYWDEDDILEKRMFDVIFKENKRELGQVTSDSLSQLWTFYGGNTRSSYYWETYVLFGDPSISLNL